MKKTILAVLAIFVATAAFAQKANIKKVQRMLDYADPAIQIDLSNLAPEKREEMKKLIEEALVNPETENNFKTWEYKARLEVYDRIEIMAPYVANGNSFVDKDHMKRFFQNEKDIVVAFEKYYKLITTPDDKGKLPLKEDDFQKQKIIAQQASLASRTNLYVGATQFIYEDADFALDLLENYYKSFDDPLFADQDLKNTDPNYKESAYVYATALKEKNGVNDKVVELLEKSLDTHNGAYACQELITYYRDKKDQANEIKYLKMAYEKYPKFLVFGVQYAETFLQHAAEKPENYQEAIKICDTLIQRMKDGSVSKVDANGNPIDDTNNYLIYYYKALSLFNTQHYKESYETFAEGDEMCPGHMDLVCGAGKAAFKYAFENIDNKEISNPMFEKAVEYFSKAEDAWPDKPEEWGYNLYVCYHNLGNDAMKQKYVKYAE